MSSEKVPTPRKPTQTGKGLDLAWIGAEDGKDPFETTLDAILKGSCLTLALPIASEDCRASISLSHNSLNSFQVAIFKNDRNKKCYKISEDFEIMWIR